MNNIWVSIRVCVGTILLCTVLYPLLVLGVAVIATPDARQGSLIVQGETLVGSSLIAQRFEKPEYFWGRPSAVDYNASAAGGSNLSPKNQEITKRAAGIVERLSPPEGEMVPADLVLASGSGLDPHLTQAAALIQVERVAKARGLSLKQVTELVGEESASSALSGAPIVNVLELNLALDRLSQ